MEGVVIIKQAYQFTFKAFWKVSFKSSYTMFYSDEYNIYAHIYIVGV